MKEMTKEIRKDVKQLIEKVGGTNNITNQDKTVLFNKYTSEQDRKQWNSKAVDVQTTISNQIDYFRYSKGL